MTTLLKRKLVEVDDDYIVEVNSQKKRKAATKTVKSPKVKKVSSKPAKSPKVKKVPVKPAKIPKVKKEKKLPIKSLKDERKESLITFADGSGCGTFNDYQKCEITWEIPTVLCEIGNTTLNVARNLQTLFNDDNTVPFIARYRRELIGNMPPEKLRDMKEKYDMITAVKKKANNTLQTINKLGKVTPELFQTISNCRSMVELEHVYAPFKSGNKRTLADRARHIGLEDAALAVLRGNTVLYIESEIDPTVKGKSNFFEVQTGIQHIIADIISKDSDTLKFVRQSLGNRGICIETSKSRAVKKEDKSRLNQDKFEQYYQFSSRYYCIKPHQVLAINRAESEKAIMVKVNLPSFISKSFYDVCVKKWGNSDNYYPLRSTILNASVTDSFERLVTPLITRQIRSDLKEKAEKASVDVFSENLNRLLLTPPVRGKIVLAIDPGFSMGCKLAVTSPSGEVLHTDVVYPLTRMNNDSEKLINLVKKYGIETVAIGNGTACRETELYLTKLIQCGSFQPLDVVYTIISEQGVSIYSCSKEATAEFPDMDANVISAVSLSRRLQDPLLEYVKVEPKHLGIGMYQHDIPKAMLQTALDEVVVECVSFVGVDLNVASVHMLRRVAGLNKARAESIIKYRSENGPFQNRSELMAVKGIGDKSYQQCAGFVRIVPQTLIISDSKSTNKKKIYVPNPLDRTCIHPESYDTAQQLMKDWRVDQNDIGNQSFIAKIYDYMRTNTIESLASKYGVGQPTMQLIVEGLQQSSDYDMRARFEKPLFRKNVLKMEDLRIGMTVTGKVQNCTHFGSFVDIGVGTNALLHPSRTRGRILKLGDVIVARVQSVDFRKNRISLELMDQ